LKKIEWDWRAILYIGVEHVLALTGILYLFFLSLPQALILVGMGLGWYLVRMLAITAGYHRCYAHEAFKCAKIVSVYFLAFGAASVQYAVKKWAAFHIYHHLYTDTDLDPTNIKRGFWWAHIVCWMTKLFEINFHDRNLAHLVGDPLVNFQNKWYRTIQFLVGLVLPVIVALPVFGFDWKAILGVVLIIFTSLAAQRHATGLVNSAGHMYGSRNLLPQESGTNNFWVNIVTLGECEQNTHHGDSRRFHNGSWYDPTGWFIWILYRFRLAWDLK
jgi:stearoyl-CoA desaturase (delta-9 desaturase)